MGIIYDFFKGLIALSIVALIQNGCSVKTMVEKALKAHKAGLTSYSEYSSKLTKKK